MQRHLLLLSAILIGATLPLHADSPASLLVDLNLAEAKENHHGALVIPNSNEAQPSSEGMITATSRTEGGTAYKLADIVTDDGHTALTLDPEKKAYFQSVLSQSNAPANDDFTVAFWYKPASDLTPATLISAGTAEPTWFTRIGDDGRLVIWFNGMPSGQGAGKTVTLRSAGPIRSDEWNHIAIVFDRNDAMIVYLNGDLDITGPSIQAQTEAMPSRLLIGGPNPYAGGKLGRIQLYRGKLGADEIRKLAAPQ